MSDNRRVERRSVLNAFGRFAVTLLAIVVMAVMPGCNTTEQVRTDAEDSDHVAQRMAEGVTLRDLRSPRETDRAAAINNGESELPDQPGTPGDTVAASPAVNPPDADTPTPVARFDGWLRIEKQLYPMRNARLKLAMNMVDDPPGVPKELLDRWKANGLRVGVIDANRVGLFRANLPRPITKLYRMPMHRDYTPLTLIHRIRGVQQVQVIGGDNEPEPVKLVSGEWQMLAKLMPPLRGDDAGVWIDILPHHYGPQPTLLPRRPDERILDGRSFHDLRLAHPIQDGHVWMIWAEVPDRAEPSLGDKKTAEDGKTLTPGEAEVARRAEAERARKEAKDQPLRLGEAMMTGRRGAQPVQLVLMFYLEKR